MVAWFTVVVEANCIRQPVSFLFPHSGIRKRGNKEASTASLVGCYNQIREFVIQQINVVVMQQHRMFQSFGFSQLQLAAVAVAEEGPRTETFYAVVRNA